MDVEALVQDFLQVAALAGVKKLGAADIEIEVLKVPHRPPSRLPAGRMAVYVLSHAGATLKVGKAGPKSSARYTTQHYNAGSAPRNFNSSNPPGGINITYSDGHAALVHLNQLWDPSLIWHTMWGQAPNPKPFAGPPAAP